MNTIFPILKAHLTSARNGLRHDTRMRIVWTIALILDLALASWSIPQLITHVTQWQAQSSQVVTSQLYLLYLLAWSGISFFTMISTLQYGFGSDEFTLLLTLPISPAARFRTLYLLMFTEGIGNWLLLQTLIFGTALSITLHWQALPWLALLLLGTAIIVECSIIATLLFIRYILPNGKTTLQLALLLCLILTLLGLIAHFFGFSISSLQPLPSSTPPTSELLSLPLTLLLIAALGPLASPTGKLYLVASQTIAGRSGRRLALNLPGIPTLSRLLSHHRTLTIAFLVKGLLNQSRYFGGWWRSIAVIIVLALFPIAHQLAAIHHISNLSLVILYAAGAAILPITEYAPYTLSGEGNRLALYLTAPLTLSEILRARIASFLLPIACIALPSTLILGLLVSLSPIELTLAIPIVTLILIGYTAFTICGSIWGEDLNLQVEGFAQTLLQEEMPITPQRIWLLSLSVLLLGAMALLVWQLPTIIALLALILFDGVVLAIAWHLSLMYLRRLLKL